MIIVISGIKRSGSTAQFNMVRLCCLHAGLDVHTWGEAYTIKDGVNIIKMHPFDKSLYNKADYIFTTDRNDKDILNSLQRVFGGSKRSITWMRKQLELWRRKSIHMHYDEIVNKPLECIYTIKNILGLDIDCEAVLKEFEAIKPPKEGYDDETFLFANHISHE